ncbi:MAG: hypothetical protein HRT47_09860 [Candidatus Caenarcaniphilales bacterium]|nr:hypothetical protein [Candidatus Caenarcaniphilales bacterium]
MRPNIKISGIFSADDAKMALELGADYISFDHISFSKRFLDFSQISAILDTLSAAQKRKVVLATDMSGVDSLSQFLKKSEIRIIEPVRPAMKNSDIMKIRKSGIKIFHKVSLNSSADILNIDLPKDAYDLAIFDIRPNFISRVDRFTRNYKVARIVRDIFNDIKDNIPITEYGISGELNLDSIFTLIQVCQPDLIDLSIQFEKEHSFYKSFDKMSSFFGKLNTVFPNVKN